MCVCVGQLLTDAAIRLKVTDVKSTLASGLLLLLLDSELLLGNSKLFNLTLRHEPCYTKCYCVHETKLKYFPNLRENSYSTGAKFSTGDITDFAKFNFILCKHEMGA